MVIQHIHTYVRHKKQIYRCRDPLCTHKTLKEDIIGKASHCTTCDREIILDREHLRRAKPQCMECSNTAKAKQFRETKAMLESSHGLKSIFGEEEIVPNN